MTQTEHHPGPLVFAAAPYLNAAPLTEGMRHRKDVTLVEKAPSALAACLASGHADAALVPVVDLLADPGLTMIDGLGVGADGKVVSVLLQCNCPPAEVRHLTPDPRSRTSNLLAQLLLRRHWGAPSVTLSTNGATADATVIIGDRAMGSRPAGHAEYDMAEEWKHMTGLPFVFAVWAYQRDHPRAAELARMATASYAAGMDTVDTIADRFAKRIGLTPDFCRTYLTHHIRYTIGDREQHAIDRFVTLLKQHGLTPSKEPTAP
ncbi:MAG: menaquinone biosynthesis protein [Kiritimatiellae bacterium]|nr:menaquinone biosynthesis protein [Kiritimatiellia bacterium]